MKKHEYIKHLDNKITKLDDGEKIRVINDYKKELSLLKDDDEVTIYKYGHPLGVSSRYNGCFYVKEIKDNKKIIANSLISYYYLVLSTLGLTLPLYFSIPIAIFISLGLVLAILGFITLILITTFFLVSGVITLSASITLLTSELSTGLLYLGIGLLLTASFGVTILLVYKYYQLLFKNGPINLYKWISRFYNKKEAGINHVK